MWKQRALARRVRCSRRMVCVCASRPLSASEGRGSGRSFQAASRTMHGEGSNDIYPAVICPVSPFEFEGALYCQDLCELPAELRFSQPFQPLAARAAAKCEVYFAGAGFCRWVSLRFLIDPQLNARGCVRADAIQGRSTARWPRRRLTGRTLLRRAKACRVQRRGPHHSQALNFAPRGALCACAAGSAWHDPSLLLLI